MTQPRIAAFTSLKEISERIPGKNFLDLGGKPLYQRAIDTVVASGLFSTVSVLASELIQLSLPPGVVRIAKPSELDLPSASSTEIVAYVAERVTCDYLLYFNVTAPFLEEGTLRALVEAVLNEETPFDSAFTGQSFRTFVWSNGEPLNFTREKLPPTQALTPMFAENNSAYVFSRTAGLQGQRYGLTPCLVEVGWPESLDIDYPSEFKIAEKLARLD